MTEAPRRRSTPRSSSGKPPAEDAWLGKATERIFLPAVRMSVPEIVDYDLPVAGAFHNCAIVSIRKTFPGQAQKIMHAIWGLGMLSLTKCVVVVDEWVDVPRLRGGVLPRDRQRRPRNGTSCSARGRSIISTTRRARSSSAASSGSTPHTSFPRRAHASGRPRSR
jgi:hypothetical protein